MTSHYHSIQTPTVRKALFNRRLQAFLVVSLASFVLISLTWPLTVKTYVSHGQIEVDVIKTPEAARAFGTQLPQIIARQTAGPVINRLAGEVQSVTPGQSLKDFSQREDFAKRFGVTMEQVEGDGTFRLNVTYRGNGTKSENYLLNLLTTNIARDFLASPQAQLGTGKIKIPTNFSNTASTAGSQNRSRRADGLSDRANALIASLETGAVSGGKYDQEIKKTSPFQTVSHSTATTTSSESIAELKQTVSQLSELANGSGMQSGDHAVAFSVRSVRALPARPINGSPTLPQMLLVALGSGIFAMFVAGAYRPFENKGFRSVASVVHKLGVPVVAKLGDASSEQSTDTGNSKRAYWANHVVHWAELVLFAVTIIAIGFCVMDAEIRTAFADNVYHGFARIAWIFKS